MFISDEELEDGDLRRLVAAYLQTMNLKLPELGHRLFWVAFQDAMAQLPAWKVREIEMMCEAGVQ